MTILKEIIIIILLSSLIPIIKNHKYIRDSGITGKLKILFLCAITMFSIYLIIKIIFSPQEIEHGLTGPVGSSFLGTVILGIISLIIGLLCIVTILILYELILFRRKRFFINNFKVLILLSIIYIFSINYMGFSSGKIPKISLASDHIFIINVLIFISIQVNALKSSWVAFLNRKQKLVSIFPLLVMIVLIAIMLNHSAKNSLTHFSLSICSLQEVTLYLFWCYVIFSFLNILIHLPSAGLFDKKVKQLSSLHQLSRSVASVLEIDKLFEEIVNLTYDITNSDSIWLLFRKNESRFFTLDASKNLLSEDKNLVNLDSEWYLNDKIIQSKSSLIINELERESFIKGISRGSIIGIPLISSKLGIIGILYAKKNNNYGYSEDEDNILSAFANNAVVAIENARYFQESLDKKELEKELAVAKKIQETLFPKNFPVIPAVEIAAINLPCREIGGDYYDLIKIDEEKLGVAIADVSGKGIPASLLMSNLQACLRTLSRENLSVTEITSRINNIICENTDEYQYITFFYSEIDTKNNRITFCNAGHNPPILLKKDGSEILLKDGGMVLGWMQNVIYKKQEMEIESGDQIIFYTDGVTEAVNKEDEAFEEWRLMKIIKEKANNPPKIIIDEIINEIRIHIAGYHNIDDLTLVVIKVQ